MKKLSKMSKILSVMLVILLIFVGCSKKVDMVRSNTAEEIIELFNKYNVENNVEEMVRLYSNAYIDYIGYDITQLTKAIKSNRKGVNIKSSTTKNIEDIDEKTKKAVVTITSVINDEESTEDYVYALIKEDDGWSISPDGIKECINFDVPMNTKKELNLHLMKEAVQFDGALIRVNVYNDTNNIYVFGSEDEKTEIIVDTTEGTYKSIVEEPQKIDKRANSYFIAKIQDLKGEIKKVTVTSVFDVDKDGNTILETKREITVYNK